MTVALPDLPLPPDWHSVTRLDLLHAVGLAHRAVVTLRGWWANSGLARVRLLASNDQLLAEVALLREELRIKDARMTLIVAAKRPQFPPQERLAILLLRTARGWSLAQTARAMLVFDDTIATWHKRIEDTGLKHP